MNADLPPLKVWISRRHLTQDDEADGYEAGYCFALQSYRGRALQFHVMLQSGAHFRHIPLHWLIHKHLPTTHCDLEQLQLWDCGSNRPVVTVFSFLRDHECTVILRDRTTINGIYWATVDWLPDSDPEAGMLLQPDQNKCAHLIQLENGQIAALPTNRIAFKDAYFIGNAPKPQKQGYVTIETIWKAESADKWSVAETDKTFY